MSTETPISNSIKSTGGASKFAVALVTKNYAFLLSLTVAFAIVALQLLQGILLARLLGPTARGEYASAMFLVNMLLYIGLLGGLEVICRYANDSDASQIKLRRAALWLGLTTGTITMVVAICLSFLVMPDDRTYLRPLAILCTLSFIGQHVMLIMTAVDRGSSQFGLYNLRRLIAAAAYPVLILIYLIFARLTLEAACYLFIVASAVSMLICLIGVPNPFWGAREVRVPRLLNEGRPYGLSMLATDLFERLDLVLVMWLTPLIDQGFYAAMIPVVYPLTVIPNTLGLFLFNAGARKDRKLTRLSVHKIIGGSLGIQALATVCFLILVGPVVTLVYSDSFAPAVTLAMWLAPVSAIKGIIQGLDGFLKGRGRPIASVWCRLFAAISMLIVVFGIVYGYNTGRNAEAIAIGALVGQIVCLVWMCAIVYSEVGRVDQGCVKQIR